ncbi:DUF378 domain-containing protein [Candidatus Paracaedibacter symbiosus]|uniref:DUF378 domain-containing protein n=1 Tax=Candidatus Paracaedibacter symbiosus TaxID=244582 RepID=UPI000509E469|nr:DUF378 domain-containing protein [Candidatus Paracaedibacter symbiosus]
MSGYTLLNLLTAAVVVIGALNWGIIGISDINLVERIFGLSIAKSIYILVGLCGLFQVVTAIIDKKI